MGNLEMSQSQGSTEASPSKIESRNSVVLGRRKANEPRRVQRGEEVEP